MTGRSWFGQHGTAAALVVIALGLGVAVWLDQRREPAADAPADRALLFPALEPDAVDALVVRRGESVLELRREAAQPGGAPRWKLGSGEATELADEKAVAELLARLALARSERAVDPTGLRAELLGVESPSWQIELEQRGHRRLLALGADAPSPPGARYAASSERGLDGRPASAPTISVVSRELAQTLDELCGRLRARGLVAGGGAVIEQIVLREPGGAERWALRHVPAWGRGPEGYRLVAPLAPRGVRADWRPVEALLAALRGLEIERFTTGADSGGADRLLLEVRGAGDAVTELSVAGPCEGAKGVRVRRSAPSAMAGCVPAEAVAAIDVPAERLVDRHVVGASASLVAEVKVARGTQAVEVARRGHGWIMRAPQEGDADAGAVDAWLAAMLALSGDVVAVGGEPFDGPGHGLDPAEIQGRFVSVGVGSDAAGATERIEQVEVGAPRGESRYLRRLEDGAVLRLDRAAASALAPDSAMLRDPTVFAVPSDRVVRLDVAADGVLERIEWSGADMSWRLVEPQEPALRVDSSLVGELLERVSKLRAVRWVETNATRATGLDRPWCTVELRFGAVRAGANAATDDTTPEPAEAPSSGVARLRFGLETAGGYFAQADDEPTAFVAPRQTALLACGWLLERGALLLELGSVTKVSLRAKPDAPTLVVVPRAGEWEATRGGEPVRGAGSVVHDALEGLFAEAAVRVGKPTAAEGLDRPQLEMVIEQRPQAGSGRGSVTTLLVGAGDAWRGTNVFYVRRADVPATYVVAQARLRPLLDLF